jgi:hypothetical protein
VNGLPDGIDISGPVQAEVFVVWLNADHLELTGPCGAGPWLIELGNAPDPMATVKRIVQDVVGEPRLLHSTSWRRDRDAVILSFVVVIDEALATGMESAPIGRVELARSGATSAPSAIAAQQVVEHGLRHLAWLAADDPVVRTSLPESWRAVLSGYVPEPFRMLS